MNIALFFVFIILFLLFAMLNGKFLENRKMKGLGFAYKSLFSENTLFKMLFVFTAMGVVTLLTISLTK